MKKKNLLWTPLLIAFLGAGCAPKIYLVDRQTVLEDEAAAEWPEFEKDLLDKTEAQGPTPFATTSSASDPQKSRLYKVLNGELSSQPGKSSPERNATEKSSQ